jgi:Tfp pilus assembly protein PilO
VVIYTDSSWPLWLRVLITVFAAGLVVVMAWRYYRHFWRRS